ncbi:MAG: MFS transporter [Chloroflexi bacterium]|nr:MFS transporter [Chloroflexota bacterium]MDA1240791.1 MFS transporter [Chloroflexota bacterium]
MLSRPFLTLGFAMFCATMGLGMVTPVLPVYAKSLGATGTAIGLTFSAFALTQVFISPFAGRMADRWGRKPFLVGGLACYVLTALGWYFTDSVAAVIGFRALSGVGSAFIFSMAHAYVGDLAPTGREGRYMGAFGLFDFLGFGVGPVLAGMVRDRGDIQDVFLSMAVLFTIASVLVLILLPKSVQPGGVDEHGVRLPMPEVPPWSVVLRHPTVQALFGLRISFAFSMGASFSFIAVYMEESLAVTATMVGVLLAGQQFAGGLSQPLLVAAGYSTVALSTTYGMILVGFVIGIGIGGALFNVAGMAVQVEVGRILGMATVASLQSMAFALGVLGGSLGGGWVVEAISVRAVFGMGAMFILLGAAFFVVRTRAVAAEETTILEQATP